MRLLIAIDGACRRNGKPDCVASGAMYAQLVDENGRVKFNQILTVHEYGSTNQRGELLALLKALDYVHASSVEALVVTDSEYLFNCMTKQWYVGWRANGWLTRDGGDVKNKDIWMEIVNAYDRCCMANIDISFYHTKGHVIPFGKVTANNLLADDPTGAKLFDAICVKYDQVMHSKMDKLQAAKELFEKNNGFEPTDAISRCFITLNTVVDAIATKVVDAADLHS